MARGKRCNARQAEFLRVHAPYLGSPAACQDCVMIAGDEEAVVEETKFWQSAGSGPLGRIWDNTEDDVYAELLES